MFPPLIRFVLVALLEAISAVVEFLKAKLMSQINPDGDFAFGQYA